jgi:hypothetical protein
LKFNFDIKSNNSNRDRNRSFQTKTVIINKDLIPLYYWRLNNSTEENFSDKLSYTLDIRAVRGLRTRNVLISKFNLTVPEIYGDPALLLPYYLSSYKKSQ